MSISSIPTFSSLSASILIATAGTLLTAIGILDTPRMLIVGSIMPLLPGVSFIKGVRDLISGDLISGVARAFDAGMTAIAIASGVGLILDTPRMLIVGSIMPLLPGVSFIKGVRDLISGDLISGVARAFDAGMTAIAIASGVGLVLNIYINLSFKYIY